MAAARRGIDESGTLIVLTGHSEGSVWGGTLARTAWDGFLEAAREIADAGTFSRFEGLPDVDALLGG